MVDPTYELAKQAQTYMREVLDALGIQCIWESWLGQAGIHLRCRIGDAVVEFKSAEHPNRLVSVPVDGIWINEAARVKDETWAGNLASRLIATRGWVILDSTPLGENWVYREFYVRGLPEGHPDYDVASVVDTARVCSPERQYCTHTWTALDNPAVDQDAVERARETLPSWAFEREWMGDPHHFAGQLFPHWHDSVNVRSVSLQDWPEVELAVDWGFGAGHPFALLMVGVDRHHRRVGVAQEHVAEGMLFEDQVALIARWCEDEPRIRKVTGDSADPGMLAMARARRLGRHVDVVPAAKGPGSVYDGTVAQADMIGAGDYIVDPKCTTTIRQHKGARWKPRKAGDQSGEVTEEPLRKDDDTVAAMRYLIHPRLSRARRPVQYPTGRGRGPR